MFTAQIYMAYARKWFRDMNYEANHYDDEEKEDPSVYDPFTSQTRFAPDVDEETLDAMTTNGILKPIESLRNIIEQDPREPSYENRIRKFVVTNLDIEPGTSFLSWSDPSQQGRWVLEPLVAPGKHHSVVAPAGSPLTLLTTNGRQLKKWKIPYEITQLVVSKQVAGLEDDNGKQFEPMYLMKEVAEAALAG
jgi:hypothetical protein